MTVVQTFYDQLMERFGPQDWWPADSPWEVCVGVVLVQNTNWKNVEKAIAKLKENNALDAETILELEHDDLADLIRSSGYFNQKAIRLKTMADWWLHHAENAQSWTVEELRVSLFALKGIGLESADSIILYAFNKKIFVIDAYTKRVLTRHQLVDEKASYDQMQVLMTKCDGGVQAYNDYHALIVRLAKEHCRTKPDCNECPLAWHLETIS